MHMVTVVLEVLFIAGYLGIGVVAVLVSLAARMESRLRAGARRPNPQQA